MTMAKHHYMRPRRGKAQSALRRFWSRCRCNSRDNKGRTPLHAIRRKSSDVALLLLEHAQTRHSDDDWPKQPTTCGLTIGKAQVASAAFGLGVNVTRVTIIGRDTTPGIQRKSADVALLLLERGADPGVSAEKPGPDSTKGGLTREETWTLLSRILQVRCDVDSQTVKAGHHSK